MYMAFKHLHMSLALLTFLGFLLRAILAFMGSPILQKKLIKVAPHIIDTAFLASAVALMVILQQYPFTHAWLTAKIFGLIAYIVFGTMTIKRAPNNAVRSIFFILSITAFMYTAKVAITKDALFFM